MTDRQISPPVLLPYRRTPPHFLNTLLTAGFAGVILLLFIFLQISFQMNVFSFQGTQQASRYSYLSAADLSVQCIRNNRFGAERRKVGFLRRLLHSFSSEQNEQYTVEDTTPAWYGAYSAVFRTCLSNRHYICKPLSNPFASSSGISPLTSFISSRVYTVLTIIS